GGGAATFWIAAADERVKCAVPVSGMSDLESYVTNKVINGHCDCMFLINTYQWEWTTIAALVAPRPLLFANSDNDRIFPMDGNRRIIERLRHLYKMYDRPELVDEYVSKGGHDYRPDLRVAVFSWINKHIKNDTGPVKDADFKPLPGKELRVFPEDADVPKDAINGKIDETFVPRAQVKLPEEGKFAEWKKGLMKELRERSFRTFAERIPRAEAVKDFQAKDEDASKLSTESSIENVALRVYHKREQKTKKGCLIVVNSGEDASELESAIETRDVDNVFLLWPRGVVIRHPDQSNLPDLSWASKSPPNYVERSHALLGRTVDEGRVWDIVAVARYLG